MYNVTDSQQSASISDEYLTENSINCTGGWRLNDGHTSVVVECMATGYWRDHDFYVDCARKKKKIQGRSCVQMKSEDERTG